VILPDVNVLVAAAHRDAVDHRVYADWLPEVLAGPEPVALVEPVLTGALRVLTSPRVFADPMPPDAAWDFVAVVRRSRACQPLPADPIAWDKLRELVDADRFVRGNVIPDAWIAALALVNGARVATADRGFGRFSGLSFFDPARQ